MRFHTVVATQWSAQSALPYKVYYSKMPENYTLLWPSGNYSIAGFYVHLDRFVLPFIVNIYIPTTLLVIISWIRYLLNH